MRIHSGPNILRSCFLHWKPPQTRSGSWALLCCCSVKMCGMCVCTPREFATEVYAHAFPFFFRTMYIYLALVVHHLLPHVRSLSSVRAWECVRERASEWARRRNRLRAKEGKSKSGRERERHTKNASAHARNNYKMKFSRVKSRLIGCNNGGGGGKFSRVKRLVRKCIRRLKRLFSGFSCFWNKQSYSPPSPSFPHPRFRLWLKCYTKTWPATTTPRFRATHEHQKKIILKKIKTCFQTLPPEFWPRTHMHTYSWRVWVWDPSLVHRSSAARRGGTWDLDPDNFFVRDFFL